MANIDWALAMLDANKRAARTGQRQKVSAKPVKFGKATGYKYTTK